MALHDREGKPVRLEPHAALGERGTPGCSRLGLAELGDDDWAGTPRRGRSDRRRRVAHGPREHGTLRRRGPLGDHPQRPGPGGLQHRGEPIHALYGRAHHERQVPHVPGADVLDGDLPRPGFRFAHALPGRQHCDAGLFRVRRSAARAGNRQNDPHGHHVRGLCRRRHAVGVLGKGLQLRQRGHGRQGRGSFLDPDGSRGCSIRRLAPGWRSPQAFSSSARSRSNLAG